MAKTNREQSLIVHALFGKPKVQAKVIGLRETREPEPSGGADDGSGAIESAGRIGQSQCREEARAAARPNGAPRP